MKERNKINQINLKLDTGSFFNSDVKIRFIEKMSNTKSTIVVIDRKHFLVMELKDDAKDSFAQSYQDRAFIQQAKQEYYHMLQYLRTYGNNQNCIKR